MTCLKQPYMVSAAVRQLIAAADYATSRSNNCNDWQKLQ